MNLYPDSSFIVSSRVPHDTFHRQALKFYTGRETDLWFWSPWHRVEVSNTVRQSTRNPDRKRGITQAEAKSLIYRIEADVRLGYFFHMEADWRDVLRTASEISAENAFARACPGTDLLHVAYAKEFAADLFVSFDEPLTYQWNNSLGAIAGATNATLILTNAQPSEATVTPSLSATH